MDEPGRDVGEYWNIFSVSIRQKFSSRLSFVGTSHFRYVSTISMPSLSLILDQCQKSNSDDGVAAFDLVDVLTSSAQNVVHMLCEGVASRIQISAERPRKQFANPLL